MASLSALELHSRPREKLSHSGPQHLSDCELLAILLNTGTKSKSVLDLAELVLDQIDRQGDALSLQSLRRIPGVGQAKASLLLAALEFARRRIKPHGTKIKTPNDIFSLVRHLADRKQESFIVISLNGAHEVIATRVVTIGLLDRTQVHPREVFADPITDRAAAVVLAHNHPSGELSPSNEDQKVTRVVIDAGKILGIRVLDHVIFSDGGFVSMNELGLMS